MFSFLRKIFIRILFLGGLVFALIFFFKIDKSKLEDIFGHLKIYQEKISQYTDGDSTAVKDGGQDNNSLAKNKQVIVKDENSEGAGKEFSGTEDDLIVLINKERLDRGLETLKKNSLLMLSAKDKALDMVGKKYFEHISDDKIQPWFFAEKNDYRYQAFAENIATDYFSANSVHRAFMDSEGHRENILGKDFHDIGIAIVPIRNNDKINYIVVEHFGAYLKDLNLSAGYNNKNRLRCKIQKRKRKELLEMIHWQKNHNKDSKFLKNLEKLEKSINLYLKECQDLKNS